MKYLIFTLALMRVHLQLAAQTPLSIPTQNRCSYSGTAWDDELYRFDYNAEVESRVREILKLANATQNFMIVPTNVENVAAIVDNGQRYLYYSLDFVQKNSAIDLYGALAHEIGHHLNNHTLQADRRTVEESEADFFMGYILSKKNFKPVDIDIFLEKLPSAYDFSFNERRTTIIEGYKKADKLLQLYGMPYNTASQKDQLTLPSFGFHKCYATFDINPQRFAEDKTLGKVNEHLKLALDRRGYAQQTYFSVANGFAIVTAMEQYNAADATIRNDRTRWLAHPARDNFSGIMDYFKSVLMPNRGYFRLFVFVVTDNPFTANPQRITKDEAAAWLSQGANSLPDRLAKLPYTEGHRVSVLVYEFEVPETNHVAEQICPAPKFDARTHLTKAGIDF